MRLNLGNISDLLNSILHEIDDTVCYCGDLSMYIMSLHQGCSLLFVSGYIALFPLRSSITLSPMREFTRGIGSGRRTLPHCQQDCCGRNAAQRCFPHVVSDSLSVNTGRKSTRPLYLHHLMNFLLK